MGAPVLAITRGDDANRLHGYISEVLLAEGYPWIETIDLAAEPLTRERLGQAQVAVLSSIALGQDEVETLLGHVAAGGNLVALRPPVGLAEALGLSPYYLGRHPGQERALAFNDRWVSLNPASPLAAGIAAPDLQFHGRADLYTWGGEPSAVVAHLAPFLGQPSIHPAVLAIHHGRGRVALFTYDLATSTVLFHQGRREQSSIGTHADYDGDARYMPNDMFVGYLDDRLKHVPQADIHQDVLVRAIEWLAARECPIPRLWYFPGAARAVAFFNGDGDAMSTADLRNVVEQADRLEAPFTTYLMLDNYEAVPPDWEAELRVRGHGFGVHAWAGPLPTLEQMRRQLREEHAAFAARYGHRPVSYRGHNVVWVGWTEMAKYLAENGVRLDTNFIPYRFHLEGYITGSGLPAKFMDEEGRLVDVYEQCTISTDDGWLSDRIWEKTCRPSYSVEECIARSRQQLEDAIRTYHTVYHPYFHPIHTSPAHLHTQPWLTAMLWYARKLGVPRVSDAAWVRFNDARRAMRLESLRFDAGSGRLAFALRAPQAIAGASVVLPGDHAGRPLAEATIDGEPARLEVEQLEGRPQALLAADFAAGQLRRYEVWWR